MRLFSVGRLCAGNLVLLLVTAMVKGDAEAEANPEADADPQLYGDMAPVQSALPAGGLPMEEQTGGSWASGGSMGPPGVWGGGGRAGQCGMVDQCCGMAEQGCCQEQGQKCYTIYERKCRWERSAAWSCLQVRQQASLSDEDQRVLRHTAHQGL